MSNNINEGDICQVLFEDIPSDENSDTSCDESDDDKDYCLPSRQIDIMKIKLNKLNVNIIYLTILHRYIH